MSGGDGDKKKECDNIPEQQTKTRSLKFWDMCRKERSSSSEQLQLHRVEYFDFGKPCEDCKINKDKALRADRRCIKCFHITCLSKPCSEDNGCNFLNEKIKKMTSEATGALWKRILDKRQCEESVRIQYTTSERIHEAEVTTIITLTKRFTTTHQNQGNTSNNNIRMEIIGVPDKNNLDVNDIQTVFVRLEDRLEMMLVGLYEKGGTNMEMKLQNSLKQILGAIPLNVSVVKNVPVYLEKCEGYLIVICLHQSRMKEDVQYTLENIQEKYYRRIILVLLHFKMEDTDCHAAQIHESWPSLKVIDYFQHQGKENMKEVIDKMKAVIFDL